MSSIAFGRSSVRSPSSGLAPAARTIAPTCGSARGQVALLLALHVVDADQAVDVGERHDEVVGGARALLSSMIRAKASRMALIDERRPWFA